MVFVFATGFRPVPASIEQLAGQARLVVRGIVTAKSCHEDSEARIFTRIELAVKEVWKGAATGAILHIVQSGGVLGNRMTTVSGQANYRLGEEVVVFLDFNERGEAVTLGLSQGKVTVNRPATSDPDQATTASTQVGQVAKAARVTGSGPAMALEELRRRVMQASVR